MSFGGGGGGSKDAIKHQNEQIKKKFEYDKKNYEYQWGIDESTGEQLTNADGTKKGTRWEDYYRAQESLELRKQADQETKKYQEDTADQQWEMGKAQQDYQWDQQDKVFAKSEDQYESTLLFNQIEYNDALEREKAVLDEKFIESAFQNQGLIQDLYEATGTAGYDKAAQKLGLLKTEDTIESQKQKKLTTLNQNTASARLQKAGTQLNLVDKSGRTDFEKAGLIQDFAISEAANRFKKASLVMDVGQQDRAAEFQNELIRRQTSDTYAKAAHESNERTIAALKAQGQASLTQAGRSQGKAVQMVLAELGRQNAYMAEMVVRGAGAAEARAKQNSINAASYKQKAKLQLDKIAEDSSSALEKTMLNLEEKDRDLKITNAKGELTFDQIRKQVYDNIENTSIDVKTLENNLKHAQTDVGLNLKKIDWNLDNLGSRFKTNQDILKASLDSAVEVSAMNQKDILRAKQQANLEAEARRMLDPSIGREQLDLVNYKPLDLPDTKYQDPQEPKLPPAPIEGAYMDTSIGAAGFAGAALGGVSTGLATYAGISAAASSGAAWATGLAAGPIGVAVGALSFLSAL
tara:strand:+ start:40 stop:1773 length:1734 start_codon:yes stop_codon:yes gene_type:complete